MELKNTEWKNAIVFISSTFNDMHSERDYLIKEVFPKLTEWCEQRKIRLTDIDLRWGVSEEDSSNSKTIETCLRHVDKSRPFFLCFLGQRRGWVPNFEKDISKETKDTYGIKKLENRSATEMEIEHALLEPLHILLNPEEYKKEYPNYPQPTKHSLFFFRNEDYAKEESGNLSPYQRLIYTNDYLKVISASGIMGELKKRDKELYHAILNKLIEDFKQKSLNYPQFISEFISDINSYDCNFYNNYLMKGLVENPLDYIDIIAEFKFKNQALYKDIVNQIKENDENLYNELTDKLEDYQYAYVGMVEFSEEFADLDSEGLIETVIHEIDVENNKEFEKHESELENYRTKIVNKKAEEDNAPDSKDKVHVIIEDYEGTWNSELPLPELSHYRFGEGQGRLTDFECRGMPLRDVIINHFIEQFEIEFADHLKMLEELKNDELHEDLIEDLEQQDNFRYINSEGFVPREEYTDKLKAYVEDEEDNKICLVSAKGGYGKTMLLANFATEFDDMFPNVELYSRFCGNSKLSSKTHSLWKSIVDEAGISDKEDFYPHNIDELRRNIDDILNKLCEGGKTVIIIDAINQLDDGLEMFKWLGTLPDNLKLIISAKEDSQLEKIKGNAILSQNSFELSKLDEFKDGNVEKAIGNLNDYVDNPGNEICLVKSSLTYDKSLIFDKFSENQDRDIIRFSCKVQDSDCPSNKVNNSIREITGNVNDIKGILEGYLNEISDDSTVIVDALSDDADLLEMLSKLDYDFNLIIGIKKSGEDIFKNTSQYSFELEELDKEKKDIIQSYLKNYLKELDEKEIHDISNFEGSENPLYLKILLAELRVFGSFDQLKDEIKKFGTSPVSAFNQVLVRLENDEKDLKRGTSIVPLLFSLLSSARVGGLSENELISIILGVIDPVTDRNGDDITEKFVQDNVRLNLRQVRPFMARKEAGRHDFFYEQFREAAENRYAEMKKDSIELLKNYFKKEADPSDDFTFTGNNPRAFIELPYYLNEFGDKDALEKTLSNYSFIKNKLDAIDIYSLVLDYNYLDFDEDDDEHPLSLIRRALELSAPVLMSNKEQLPNQLWGRMKDIDDDVINALRSDLENYSDNGKWLKSTANALYSPKSAIIKRLRPDGKRSSTAIAYTENDKIIFGSEDGVLNLYNVDDNTFEVLEKTDSMVIKIILNYDGTMYVARRDGTVKYWDINVKNAIETYHIDAELTDIYYSKTYNKIYASSYTGIYSINLETTEIRREDIPNKDYNQILVPRRNEAILVCDNNEVDGWDVYEMRKAYNKHHQQNITDDDDIEGDISTKTDSSGDIKFMGLIKRFIILISENGQMKMWNTLQNSGGGQSIDEKFTSSLNDQFRQAVTLEDEKQVVTMSKMGVLRVWNIPEPKNPTFRMDKYDNDEGENAKNRDIQTGIVSTTAMEHFHDDKHNWIIIGNEKSDISIIDLDKQTEETEHEKHTEAVLSIKIHDDKMITASENGEIYVWDLNEDEIGGTVRDRISNDFRTDCISYDYEAGKLVSTGIKHEKNGTVTNKLAVIDINTNEVEREDKKDKRIIDVAQNSDGIVYIDENGLTVNDSNVSLDDAASTLCTVYDSGVVFIGFANGKVAKYENNEIKFFDSNDGSEVTKIKTLADKVIAGHESGAIEVFALDGTHLFKLEGHEDAITNICISKASEFITVSKDSCLKIWNIDKKECIYTYYADIYGTSVNVKDNRLVIGDTLGNVRFFSFENFTPAKAMSFVNFLKKGA